MAADTKIEWASKSWNPLLGCDRVSPACDSCYAIGQARIRESNPNPKIATAFAGLVQKTEVGLDWTGQVNLLPERLAQPLRWKKPQRIFVNSLSDLFHKSVPVEYIAQVFAIMALAPQHTFLLLTKRHARMHSVLNDACTCGHGHLPGVHLRSRMAWAVSKANPNRIPGVPDAADERVYSATAWDGWPLPNVHLGVSVENQKWADVRIPALLDTPAAVRWISAEPLLGPVDLSAYLEGAREIETPRGRLVLGGRIRRVEDRPAGPDMAGISSQERPVAWRHEGDPLHAQAGGERYGNVPSGPRDEGWNPGAGVGAPSGLAPSLRADSGRPYGQPQERGQDGQQAGESGVGHALGADDSCSDGPTSRAAGPVRPAERDGEADHGAGRGDQGAAIGRRDPEVDRPGLRRADAAHLQDRAGRPTISWVVCGGETGAKARPSHPDWFRSLRDQCAAADVPYFFKQFGDWAEMRALPPGNRLDAWDEKRTRYVHPVDGRTQGHGDWGVNDHLEGWAIMQRVGKARAGRILDGVEHNGYPAVSQ